MDASAGGKATARRDRFAVIALVVGTLALLLVCHWSLLRLPLVSDEPIHQRQVMRVLAGDGSREEYLTTFATYHHVLASASALVGSRSTSTLRLLSALLSLASIVFAFRLAWRLHGDAATGALRAGQLLLLPILLPFVFLVYTDGVALAAVLGAALALSRGRYGRAAVFAGIATALRQMNVVWLAWAAATWGLDEWRRGAWRSRWPTLVARGAPFALALAAFGAFVVANGGVAIGDAGSHPGTGLHDGNVLFLLLVAFVVLLPANVAALPRIAALARAQPWLAGGAAIVVATWFTLGFEVDHHYNTIRGFLHNDVALWLDESAWRRVAIAPLAAWSALTLWVLAPVAGQRWPWLVATVLVLAPSWMIEPRYCIVPLALWLVYRPPLPAWAEAALTAWLGVLSVLAFHIVREYTVFL